MAGKWRAKIAFNPPALPYERVTLCLQTPGMHQPELGKHLTALRKEKNLTQEELVQKSRISVRTIQRIEAGEVLPRKSTVKILLEALGESFESFSNKPNEAMETQNTLPRHATHCSSRQ